MTGSFKMPPGSDHFALRFLTPEGRSQLLEQQPTALLGGAPLTVWPARIAMQLRGLDAEASRVLRAAFPERPSGTDSIRPTWTIDCRPASPRWFHSAAEASAGSAFWEYFLDLDAPADHIRISGLDFFARLERPPQRRLEVWMPEGLADGRLVQAAHNLLRVATAFAVVDSGGLLLHSAALLAESGLAVVCPGRSGAGKSTLSARATALGWQVLSDELNVVWLNDDNGELPAPCVEQVPFTGDLGRLRHISGRFPVVGVLPLVRSGRDERIALSPAKYYARTLAEAVFANCDPQTSPLLESTVTRLVDWAAERGGLEALSFTPDGQLDALLQLSATVAEPRLAKVS